MTEQAEVKVSVILEMTVDQGWIEFITGGSEGYVDVFLGGYCGYWMEGIDHDAKLGWLAYEFGAEDRHSTEKEKELAIMVWRAGGPLPKHFHALNLEAAKKSWQEGVKEGGLEWYENGDGNTYDLAVQRALLGELTYS